MNFFEHQDIAQRNTKRLIILLCMAVISLITITTLFIATFLYLMEANSRAYLEHIGVWQGVLHSITPKMVAIISSLICLVIFSGSLFKWWEMARGGRAVAEALGGRLLILANASPDERKILNVVEEMAIASGTPVPPVYLLEESAINAFAAGHHPQDAVIGVTRGCIQHLTRDELQGVIAHEFSHIFHGDMNLNMRLIALLNGILLLGLTGQFLIRNSGRSRERSYAALMGLGVGLIIIGYAGTFFGSLIKAAVSRQREFLADASAVKYTRNPAGIGSALKKLGGYSAGSELAAEHTAQFSHLFFGEAITAPLFSMMATHPPLEERIKRIDPHWDGKFIAPQAMRDNSYIEEERLATDTRESAQTVAMLSAVAAMDTDKLINSIGHPNQQHIHYAQQTITAIPDELHKAAHTQEGAPAIIIGLLLDKNALQQAKQWEIIGTQLAEKTIAAWKPVALQTNQLSPSLRLPLLEMSLPSLKGLPDATFAQFKTLITAIIHADNQINLLEWSLYRIITHYVEARPSTSRTLDLQQLRNEAHTLLSVVAHAGGKTKADAESAFNNSKTLIGLNDANLRPVSECGIAHMDNAIARMNRLKPLQKPLLLKALSQCIMADEKITVIEAELFRAISDALDCPVPPLLATTDT